MGTGIFPKWFEYLRDSGQVFMYSSLTPIRLGILTGFASHFLEQISCTQVELVARERQA